MYQFDKTDELVTNLSRPIYNLRMARSRLLGHTGSGTPNQKAAWNKKAIDAKREIEEIVRNYGEVTTDS